MTDLSYRKLKLKAKSYFNSAYQMQKQGKLKESIYLYKCSLEILPTAEAYTYLGWAYSWNGEYEKAIEECKKAISLDPDYGNAYNDIGAYLISLNRTEEAIPWLKRALKAKRYENYAYPYLNLGRIYEQKGHWSYALRYYRLSMEERPDYQPAKTAYDKLHGRFN